jgi:hypothetical protein
VLGDTNEPLLPHNFAGDATRVERLWRPDFHARTLCCSSLYLTACVYLTPPP